MPSEQIDHTLSVTQINFRLQPNLRLIALGLLLLPILILLGVWQLDRADEKQLLLDAFEQRQNAAPVKLNDLSSADISSLAPFTKVTLEGAGFDKDIYWLLDNRIQNGQFGYEVLQVAKLKQVNLLINRGWVPGSHDRRVAPSVELITGHLDLSGRIAVPSKNAMIGELTQDPSMPQRIIQIDLDRLSHWSGAPLTSLILIDAQSTAALSVHWPTVNISPSKHQGYAVQWFSMAAALVLLLIFANSNLLVVLRQNLKPFKIKDVDS